MEDTIVSVSTAQAKGAISIVRLSGSDSVFIVKKIFTNKEFLKNPESHRLYYGKIIDGKTEIDECIVSLMLAPKSYTKEDVAEISCHGGLKITQKILGAAVKAGARLAAPGEFTKRAFLNGRIDLTQAEAVCDLINSSTELAAKTSYNQLSGSLKSKISDLRERVLTMTAALEVSVDFPEHGPTDTESVLRESTLLLNEINALLNTADYGKIIHNGIETAIAGRPNVGKSSLLNAILKEDRAIVTKTPGTTRDILQDYVNIFDIVLKLTDMAGIRDTNDMIESLGVARAKAYLEKAELVLLVLDGSEALTNEDFELFELISGKKAVVLVNKTDIESVINLNKVRELAGQTPVIFISAKENKGLEGLYDCIRDMFLSGALAQNIEYVVYKERHLDCLSRARESLERVLETIQADLGEDLLTADLMEAYSALGEITGETLDDDVIDKIFSEFCVGK